MGVADDLEKLTKLHEAGDLSDDEYAQAKNAVLEGAALDSRGDFELVENLFGGKKATIGEAANRFVSLQTIVAVISLIIFLLFLFLVFLPGWNELP